MLAGARERIVFPTHWRVGEAGALRTALAAVAEANSATDSTLELKDNTIIVVLGASGDLAKKKTVGCARFFFAAACR